MRNKTPLALIEQAIMVLVFALASALCLWVFILSDRISRENSVRDQAVLQVENAAEIVKSCPGDGDSRLSAAALRLGGTFDSGLLQVDYSENWVCVPPDGTYCLTVRELDSGVPGLGLAEIQAVAEASQDILFQVQIAWQEVTENG